MKNLYDFFDFLNTQGRRKRNYKVVVIRELRFAIPFLLDSFFDGFLDG
jgi:hypothetical protein